MPVPFVSWVSCLKQKSESVRTTDHMVSILGVYVLIAVFLSEGTISYLAWLHTRVGSMNNHPSFALD